MRACVVLPTYNEAGNIIELLDQICCLDVEVLVVDDNSPDGTGQLVLGYMQKQPRVHVLLRKKKQGLGAAYIAGIQKALEQLKPDAIVEMDADFSHEPERLERLIERLSEHDFVIGSRYVPGAKLPRDWGRMRVATSWLANAYARTMLGLPVNDCTSGFRAMRASIFERIKLENLGAKGYVFQVALLNAVAKQNLAIVEIPIHFRERRAGRSKLSISDAIEGGFQIAMLRLKG